MWVSAITAIKGTDCDGSGEAGASLLGQDAWVSRDGGKVAAVRAMAFIWAVILVGGIAYFSVIGLTHH
jgi:hypothetical protein